MNKSTLINDKEQHSTKVDFRTRERFCISSDLTTTRDKQKSKLEELAEPERNIYFPETSKSQPFMHVHGNPTFSILYRLVDYCYNITFINRVGEVELKPTNRLQCTFRIYMPYGNRVALKLQIGDSAAKEKTDTLLNFQDLKNGISPCDGLLTEIHDGDAHWRRCTKKGDQERQIDILSKENKIVLKVVQESETSQSLLKLRMSYRAEPVEAIVGLCEFGWVAMRQFCVTVVDTFKLSWTQAESECMKRGGHLVSVRSERDQRTINLMLSNSLHTSFKPVENRTSLTGVVEDKFNSNDHQPSVPLIIVDRLRRE
ncbi:hypothetical protein D910_08940, partial [Dendroctonus ponderosae]